MFESVHVVLFSHIFISIALLCNFLIRYVWTCSIYIYIWSKMFKDVFKPVDFHCDTEVRNFFKFHISQLLFSSSAAHVYTFVYLLMWLKSFFSFYIKSTLTGCNNALTDAQFESMFTTTNEEMQQTEQPMECLIERTNHKCKRCTRFFSNEAALKQHHCEPPIKKEKCPYRSKIINRVNNLEKHLEKLWEGSYTPC